MTKREFQGVKLKGYTNRWSSVDSLEVNGAKYHLLENDTYGDETQYVVGKEEGEVIIPLYDTYDDITTTLQDNGVL